MERRPRVPPRTTKLEPASLKVRIVRKGRLSVVVPLEPVKPLTAATVQKTITRLRNRKY